jgi:SAM-dependent methyltransferase
MTDDQIRSEVRKRYSEIARDGMTCCAGGGCSVADPDASARLGYSADDLAAAPDGANLGLGCGNPQAIAALRPGEVVLDLGSGGGFDCFLAARQVGPSGAIIGVDMTWEMVSKARANAQKLALSNVEFRLGEIEHLPVPDGTVDVIISNCVINLSPDKNRVFKEALRALRPGGRLAISDVVAVAPLSPEERENMALHTGCIAGAATVDEIERMLSDAGFGDVRISPLSSSRAVIAEWGAGEAATAKVLSATIEARKPGGAPAEAACCGGTAPEGSGACCALDAEVKAGGGAGCGCSGTSAKQAGCC